MGKKIGTLCFVIILFSLLASPGVRASETVLRLEPKGHMADIQVVMFTNDGQHLVSASNDKTVRVWDIETGRCVRTILGQADLGKEGMVYTAALSPDNKYLATAGWFGPSTGYQMKELGRIRIHDFQSGEVSAFLEGHLDVVNVLAFSPDGRWLASGSHDKTVHLWAMAEKPVLKAVLKGHTRHIYALAFSPDGEYLVSGSDDHDLILWRTKDGSAAATLSGHRNKVRAVAFTPDGRYIVSASWDKTIKLWDGTDGTFIEDLVKQDTIPNGLSISADGTRMLTGTYTEPNICYVYDLPSGQELFSFKEHDNNVGAIAISPDGQWAATGGGNNYPIYIWQLDTGRVYKVLTGVGASIWNLGLSEDGREIAWGNSGSEKRPLDHGPLQWTLSLHDGDKWNIQLGGKIKDAGRFTQALHNHGTLSLKTRVGGKYGVEAVLEVIKGDEVFQEIERGSTSGYAHLSYTFSPDGKSIISGGYNGVLLAYDAGSGRKLAELVGHESEVYALAVSPDGRWLVSGSKDQTIRLWNLRKISQEKTVKPLLSIFVGFNKEWVAWTPQGYYSCSIKGDRYFGWLVNYGHDRRAEFLPAERFIKQFYRPDVVSAVLDAGDLEEGIKKAGLIRETESEVKISRILPPKVDIIEPNIPFFETAYENLQVTALAQSVTGEPITKMILLHNGKPVLLRDLVLEEETNKDEIIVSYELTLLPGENEISFIAQDDKVRSNPHTITVIFSGQPSAEPIEKPVLYVLAIGISNFKDSKINLNYAHRDAEDVSRVLEKQVGRMYREVKVRLLTNEQATRGDILDGLDWLMGNVTQKDVAVLFLAGHGVNDKLGRYYFISHDTNIQRLRRSAVEWFNFKEVLTGIPARMVLLADTCHGGNITGSRISSKGRQNSDMTGALKEVVAAGTGVVVLSASTGQGYSQESPDWGHGAFTKALLDGLHGPADYNKNKEIDILETNLFISHMVAELTKGTQRPATEIPVSLGNFPFVEVLEP